MTAPPAAADRATAAIYVSERHEALPVGFDTLQEAESRPRRQRRSAATDRNSSAAVGQQMAAVLTSVWGIAVYLVQVWFCLWTQMDGGYTLFMYG